MSVYVLFFGGYQATQTDMDIWVASAKKVCQDVDYDAVPWPPGASSDATSAVNTFTKGDQFDGVITQIGTSGADETYIVGHSSGCAIANEVDRNLKDHSRITLVALDGFAPDAKQLARPSTQVWSAVGGGGTSLNYKKLKDRIDGRLRVYQAPDCSTTWALHFSLVNAAASDRVVKGVSTGYAQCRANLIWLK